MHVLVTTGGRDYTLTPVDYKILDVLNPDCLLVGDATGADAGVWDWACKTLHPFSRRQFYADWTLLGKRAGPDRNERMLQEALTIADRRFNLPLLLAFPGSKGTLNCIRQAQKMGIPVIHSQQGAYHDHQNVS